MTVVETNGIQSVFIRLELYRVGRTLSTHLLTVTISENMGPSKFSCWASFISREPWTVNSTSGLRSKHLHQLHRRSLRSSS